jgi:LysR family transcriptional regulator, nitrogen assimilation regulatory protein
MDLKHLEHFIQVAEYGSFSKAASIIGIAQPALSRQVRKLEEECGTPLLYRNGRGVSLTPGGERLLERLRPLMRQLESAVSDLHADQKSPSGVVTVGLTPTVCGMLGMSLISAVREEHPRIQLNVISGYSGYVHEWLINARLDIAILHDARRSAHLAVDPLAELQLSLISSARAFSPTARRATSVQFRELKGLPLVLPTKNHGLRRTMEYAASQAGISLTVLYEVDALALMKEIVEVGLAHTVLAAPAVRAELSSRTLIARAITDPNVATKLLLATAANRPLTQAVKAVESTMRRLLAEMARTAPYSRSMTMLG